MGQRSGRILKGWCKAQQVPQSGEEGIQTIKTVHANIPRYMTRAQIHVNVVSWPDWPLRSSSFLRTAIIFAKSKFYPFPASLVMSLIYLISMWHGSHSPVLSWVQHTPTASQASSLTFCMLSCCACKLGFLSLQVGDSDLVDLLNSLCA